MDVNITDLQKEVVGVQAVNKMKKPPVGGIIGTPDFTIDKTGVISLFPTDDGTSVLVVGLGAGTCTVSVTITSLSGVKITRTFTVSVTIDPAETEATDIVFSFGTPQAQ